MLAGAIHTNAARTPGAAAARVATLGFVGGLRSQMPLALLSVAMVRAGRADTGFLGRRGVAAALCLAALGELAGDKLPIVPGRLNPGPLAGRFMFGALAGAALSRRTGLPTKPGAALGGTGALAGSYAGYHARAVLTRKTGLPDPVWAVVEDAIALGLGFLATRHVT